MWIISEIAAMATDLAEFLGASIAINLLFGIPLLYATLITGVVTYLILTLERHGFRPIEAVITALVGVIAVCYLIETFFSHPNWGQVGFHTVVPWWGRQFCLCDLAVGFWPLQLHRRHNGRSGDYAGVCGLHHSHLGAAFGDNDPCRARCRDWLQSDQHPGDQPGRLEFRSASAGDYPDHVYTSSRSDGHPGE